MSETIGERMKPTSIDDVRAVLRRRFLTVIADLPLSQPLEASVRIALREIRDNTKSVFENPDEPF